MCLCRSNLNPIRTLEFSLLNMVWNHSNAELGAFLLYGKLDVKLVSSIGSNLREMPVTMSWVPWVIRSLTSGEGVGEAGKGSGCGMHLAGTSDLGFWCFFQWVDTYSHRETVKGLKWKLIKYTTVIFKYRHLKEQDFLKLWFCFSLFFLINHKLKERGQDISFKHPGDKIGHLYPGQLSLGLIPGAKKEEMRAFTALLSFFWETPFSLKMPDIK